MDIHTACAVVNVAICVMIAVCVLAVAVFAHSADGLWSLLALLFLMSSHTGKCNCSKED